ncbi:hypothetical protein IEN52_04735 [Stenotrophomonas rhizophila]|nr:hypothetical protein [Stenotrophomonas rhizophila]MCC7633431.1 hypothetical protein [Stenotrophomonas rhizophila]MCC7663084.1 hypothetical protein [Stenotrophomonas rhizophila]
MRAFPWLLSLTIVAGLSACQPAQQGGSAVAADAGKQAQAAEAPAVVDPTVGGDTDAGAQGAAVPAADAASSGFRATGNEPGWLAEFTPGAAPRLRVETGYGERTFEIAAPTQGKDGWSGKAADGTEIKLTFQRTVCQDDMSGQAFGATVRLTVGARQYHGCGDFVGAPALAARP